jgi:hypothetical protein
MLLNHQSKNVQSIGVRNGTLGVDRERVILMMHWHSSRRSLPRNVYYPLKCRGDFVQIRKGDGAGEIEVVNHTARVCVKEVCAEKG